jgi:hypothetical protein
MNGEIRLCTDCKYHRQKFGVSICVSPDVRPHTLVSGETFCVPERESSRNDACGREGRFFQTKSFWAWFL